ncbi:MAG: hypothetical protein KBB37_03145 [Bacteroidia bacterium]|nr:hypothetical protein [Bacteroidia bacterium]MBP7260259.1 hypothetical protein [Bacteroidia bacterium]MBP9180543.1 hypothetical protein [Bacteroidia bacterium]MBP9724505.1 hypothetical protein [Bacteroidia bacterium]
MQNIENIILTELILNQQIFREIKLSKGNNWRGQWTDKLYEIVGNLGIRLNYSVANSKKGFEEGEWLFDMVWFRMGAKNDDGLYAMKAVELVLESEISNTDIGGFKTDFDKLLVATKPTKIFITRNISKPKPNETLDLKILYAKFAIDTLEENTDVFIVVWEDFPVTNELDFKCYRVSKEGVKPLSL